MWLSVGLGCSARVGTAEEEVGRRDRRRACETAPQRRTQGAGMAPQQRRPRLRRRLACVAAAVAAAATLAAGPGFAAGTGADDRPPPSAPAPGPTAPPPAAAPGESAPAFGAYLDYGPRGVTRMAELSQWLGGARLRVGHTYLPGDRWSNIEGRPGFLDVWANWRRGAD